MDINKYETYITTPEKHGHGTFFFTDCGNRMYSIRDQYAYHGCLCPKCRKTLYIRGSKKANELMDAGYLDLIISGKVNNRKKVK